MISTELGQDHPSYHPNIIADINLPAKKLASAVPDTDFHQTAHPHSFLDTVSRSAFTTSSFEELLSITPLPPPGPSHYAARRALWLAPRHEPPPLPEPSSSRHRLEQLLSRPGGVQNEEVWKGGIEKVWKGLVSGGRLKRRLPMCIVMKIIHAGWIRDPDTWPAGAIAPEPDDVLDTEVLPVQIPICSSSSNVVSAGCSPGLTMAWMAVEPSPENERAAGMVAGAGH